MTTNYYMLLVFDSDKRPSFTSSNTLKLKLGTEISIGGINLKDSNGKLDLSNVKVINAQPAENDEDVPNWGQVLDYIHENCVIRGGSNNRDR